MADHTSTPNPHLLRRLLPRRSTTTTLPPSPLDRSIQRHSRPAPSFLLNTRNHALTITHTIMIITPHTRVLKLTHVIRILHHHHGTKAIHGPRPQGLLPLPSTPKCPSTSVLRGPAATKRVQPRHARPDKLSAKKADALEKALATMEISTAEDKGR